VDQADEGGEVSTQDTSTEDYEARLARIEAALALTPRSRCDDWDSNTVEWLLAQLRERDRQLAEAREALAPRLDDYAYFVYEQQRDRCRWCDGWEEGTVFHPEFAHDPNCPVLRKDALLGRQANDEAHA
jgi:hypothetical protein